MDKYTVLEYKYCDASNYKVYSEIRLKGKFTDSDIDVMRACMYDGEFFVPREVGLPSLQVLLSEEFDGVNEDDHDWHTIECIRPATQEDTQLPMHGTTEDIIAKFQKIRKEIE